MNILLNLGFLLVFLGIIVLVIGMFYEALKSSNNKNNNRQRTEVGGVIFIGPIPIIFGSSKNIAKWMIIVAIIIFVLLVLFYVL
ncbi:MAG: TIGR00304 family protein [Saccharolobus sp.]|jgi:uncharacterized protein (TIGR00304 family)|uniref:TIGR00304 family membrane protein n=1 Tax=Saccharolobus sp. TaxID=2100761 RepID=UPI0028CEEB90|nr:TIGR00304 family protein [Saccharolobus sp.]MDT7861728.1 TIGR00304 family protein [Saccharolobus sp.]